MPTVLSCRTRCFSLVVVVTITGTHSAYPRRDDQAELAWVAWLNAKMIYSQTVIQPFPQMVTQPFVMKGLGINSVKGTTLIERLVNAIATVATTLASHFPSNQLQAGDLDIQITVNIRTDISSSTHLPPVHRLFNVTTLLTRTSALQVPRT